MKSRLQLFLFFAAVGFFMGANGLQQSIFNNYLDDVFSISAGTRGWLEFPRELPGLLVVLMTALLAMLALTRVAVIGALAFAAGMAGLALVGPHFWATVLMMMVASAGLHLLQPVTGSIALSLSGEDNRGMRMGQMGAVGTAGVVVGTGIVWLFFGEVSPPYWLGFVIAAAAACLAASVYRAMHIASPRRTQTRFVLDRRFSLYYLLEFLFGARKQIFITFGFWVLIKVYGLPAKTIAGLLLTASIIGIFFKPLAGAAIDRFGERTIMTVDGLVLTAVCIGYGYALRITGHAATALPIASACFILDNLLFSLGTSRSVYVSRLTRSPEETTSTLAMGVSINHIASMILPAAAGLMWEAWGYEVLFAVAAGLALTIAAVSTLVPPKGRRLRLARRQVET